MSPFQNLVLIQFVGCFLIIYWISRKYRWNYFCNGCELVIDFQYPYYTCYIFNRLYGDYLRWYCFHWRQQILTFLTFSLAQATHEASCLPRSWTEPNRRIISGTLLWLLIERNCHLNHDIFLFVYHYCGTVKVRCFEGCGFLFSQSLMTQSVHI
jgi:hypothetical protein